MKLRDIWSYVIKEGVSYIPNGSWADFIKLWGANGGIRPGKKEGDDERWRRISPEFFMRNGRFQFNDVDSPSDVIKTEVVRRQLGSMGRRDESLSTFDSTIYYGFSIADPNDVSLEDDPSTKINSVELTKAKEIITALSNISDAKNLRSINAEIENNNQTLRRKDMVNFSADDRSDMINDTKILISVRDYMISHNATNIDGLISNISSNGDNEEAAAIRFRKEMALSGLSVAIGKMLKSPQSAEQLKIRHKVINDTVENFIEQSPGDYDFVLYPHSTSTMNKEFATTISGLYNIPVNVINYKDNRDDVEVDVDELRINASRIQDRVWSGDYNKHLLTKMIISPEVQMKYLGRVVDEKGINPLNGRKEARPSLWEKVWLEKETNKLEREKTIRASNMRLNNKKRYLQRFKLPDNGADYRGKSLLFVDDDIVNGGTIESIHKMLKGVQPSRIDILVAYRVS